MHEGTRHARRLHPDGGVQGPDGYRYGNVREIKAAGCAAMKLLCSLQFLQRAERG
jgi:hypothetical protein